MIRFSVIVSTVFCISLIATEQRHPLDGAKEVPTEILQNVNNEMQEPVKTAKEESQQEVAIQQCPDSNNADTQEETTSSEEKDAESSSSEVKDNVDEEDEKEELRTITITNKISKESLPYKHWTGTHTPKEFILSANDEEIEQGESKKIEIINNTVYMRYDYDFGYDMAICRGAYETEYTVKEDQDDFIATFSWNEKFRIIMPGATPIAEEKMEFGE